MDNHSLSVPTKNLSKVVDNNLTISLGYIVWPLNSLSQLRKLLAFKQDMYAGLLSWSKGTRETHFCQMLVKLAVSGDNSHHPPDAVAVEPNELSGLFSHGNRRKISNVHPTLIIPSTLCPECNHPFTISSQSVFDIGILGFVPVPVVEYEFI